MADGEVGVLNRVFRCTLSMQVRLQKIQTALHLRDIGVPNEDAESCHTHFETWMNDHFRLALSSNVSIVRLAVEEIRTKEYFAKDYTGVTGSSSYALNSTMEAVAISLKSTSRSRHANGRMFWPLLGTPQSDQVDAGALVTFQTQAASLADRYISGTVTLDRFQLVVIGAPAPSLTTPNTNPKRWTDVTNIRVNPVVTSLRSRKVGVGS